MDVRHIDIVQIIDRDSTLRRVSRTKGGEWHGPCPFCGGRDRFIVQGEGGKDQRGVFWCRSCKRYGDAISYIQQRQAVDFKAACEILNLKLDTIHRRKEPLFTAPEPVDPPGEMWQQAAMDIVTECFSLLYGTYGKPLDYLKQRGFTDEIISRAILGYNPADRYLPATQFGMDGDRDIWLPRGIVIPWFVENALWRVEVRRPVGEPKYMGLRGGTTTLYNLDYLKLKPGQPITLVEGAFNAMAIEQAAGDLTAAVALGASTHCRRIRWIGKLALAQPVLISLDNDADPAKGEEAAQYWMSALGKIAMRWRPIRKDAAAMLQAGDNLRAWVQAGLIAEAETEES